MAVKVITNACIAGALAGIACGKQQSVAAALVPANATFANWALIAKAVGTAFVTANAALTTPMADADNTEIGLLVTNVAFSQCFQQANNDTVATGPEWIAIATQIVQ